MIRLKKETNPSILTSKRKKFLERKYGFVVPDFDGMMNETKCIFLFDIVNNYIENMGNIVEIGSYKGCSTTWLAVAGIRNEFKSLYAIDLFTGTPSWGKPDDFNTFETFNERMRINKLAYFVKPIRGDSRVIIKTWDMPITILHIDGDHTYDGVKADADNYLPFLEINGIVIFDDYDSLHPDVQRIVHELINNGSYIVYDKVEEISDLGYGSIALRKINK